MFLGLELDTNPPAILWFNIKKTWNQKKHLYSVYAEYKIIGEFSAFNYLALRLIYSHQP
jgi:hypothetical protein